MFVKEAFNQDFLQTFMYFYMLFELSEFFKDLLFNLNEMCRLFNKIIWIFKYEIFEFWWWN